MQNELCKHPRESRSPLDRHLLLLPHAPPPARARFDVRQALAARVRAQIFDLLEADGGDEAAAAPGVRHLGVHLVDLLERQALGLVDERPDEDGAHGAEGAPDVEDLGLQVGVAGAGLDEVGGRVGDGPLRETLVEDPDEPGDDGYRGKGGGKLTFRSQFVAVVIDKHLARHFSGKISPVTTHAIGPQVEAKKKM